MKYIFYSFLKARSSTAKTTTHQPRLTRRDFYIQHNGDTPPPTKKMSDTHRHKFRPKPPFPRQPYQKNTSDHRTESGAWVGPFSRAYPVQNPGLKTSFLYFNSSKHFLILGNFFRAIPAPEAGLTIINDFMLNVI